MLSLGCEVVVVCGETVILCNNCGLDMLCLCATGCCNKVMEF